MTKREMIERIMILNTSARREFLQCFTENELVDYLRQLEAVQPLRIETVPTVPVTAEQK